MKFVPLLLLVSSFLSSPASAEGARGKVFKLMSEKLANRTFEWSKVTNGEDPDGTKYTTDLKRRWTFGNMRQTKEGFTFDAVVNIQQTNDYKDKDGKSIPRKRDRSIVIKYEVRELKSSGSLVGFGRYDVYLGVEGPDSVGKAMRLRIELVGEVLKLRYNDMTPFEVKRGPEAVAKSTICENTDDIDLSGQTITRTFVEQCYDVDEKTLEKTTKYEPYEIVETAL